MRKIKGGYALALLSDLAALALLCASLVTSDLLAVYCASISMLLSLIAIGMSRGILRLMGLLLAAMALMRALVHFVN
ncbi:hypothetical protein ACWKWK_04955 [Pseudoxanthomonas beigongshangi]